MQELKVLDVYLSKINPKNIDTAKVRFTKKEYCDLISVNSNWLKTKRLSKYLQHLFNNSVVEWLDDEQENFKLHHLFEEAEYDKTTQEIILECGRSDYVRSMFFDINTCGYIKYALKNTLYLKSTYSIKLYLYFLQDRFRKKWKIALEELKENILEVSDIETYSQYKFLNAYILKPSIKEINEKTNLEIKYFSIKKGNRIHTLEFTCHFKDTNELINGEFKEKDIPSISSNLTWDEIENDMEYGSLEYVIAEIQYTFKSVNKKEAAALSERLNLRGYRTLALSGEDSQEKREDAIDRLVSNTRSDYLQYILTVDIFNEGVDIPEINQVVLLRPTQSPIVFVQQLGRGLRKSQDKEYVVILDFIGNYKNNFMIPIALSGDRSYNKDNIRRYVLEGERIIPGSSTIHFDEISKKQIFASIDTANFADIKLIKDSYKNLKNKLGRIPTLMDFETYGEIDVQRIFDNKSLGSYYAFLKKYEKDYKVRLNELEESFIKFICTKLANGKRKIELEILNDLIDDKDYIFPNDISQTNVFNIFTNEFPTGSGKNTFKDCIFIEDTKISKPFKTCLENNEFKSMVKEIIEYALDQYNKHFKNTYKDTNFVLYQKYTYEDACRLLNWQHNEVPLNIGGYKYDQTTKTFPVFINYDKANDIQDTIKYEDHFINESQLIAISKSGRSTSSDDVQNFLYAKERGIEVHLFVRKNKDDKTSKEFYYLGNMQAEIDKTKQFMMPNTQKTAVEILWQLDTPVREDIYRYIVEE